MHYFETDFDFDNKDENLLIKKKPENIVDFENYKTKIGFKDTMNYAKHVSNNNMDEDIIELVANIKNDSHYKIQYEKLDPSIMTEVNNL